MPAPPHSSAMATPYRPISARPLSAARGNSFSRSQRAACGASCSAAKRRTAWRISSACADVGERVVAEQVALLAVALGHAVDAALSHLQDAGGAVDMLALGRRKEGGVQLGSQGVVVHADARL